MSAAENLKKKLERNFEELISETKDVTEEVAGFRNSLALSLNNIKFKVHSCKECSLTVNRFKELMSELNEFDDHLEERIVTFSSKAANEQFPIDSFEFKEPRESNCLSKNRFLLDKLSSRLDMIDDECSLITKFLDIIDHDVNEIMINADLV